jgi:Holliday junction resolvase RusA-like endonuclease
MRTFLFKLHVQAPPEPEPRARARAFIPKGGTTPIARVFHPRTERANPWREEIRAALAGKIPSIPWEGALGISLAFVHARPHAHCRKTGELRDGMPHFKATRPDLDNLEKLVLDVFTRAGIWRDDGQIAVKVASKPYVVDGQKPGMEVILWREE